MQVLEHSAMHDWMSAVLACVAVTRVDPGFERFDAVPSALSAGAIARRLWMANYAGTLFVSALAVMDVEVAKPSCQWSDRLMGCDRGL